MSQKSKAILLCVLIIGSGVGLVLVPQPTNGVFALTLGFFSMVLGQLLREKSA